MSMCHGLLLHLATRRLTVEETSDDGESPATFEFLLPFLHTRLGPLSFARLWLCEKALSDAPATSSVLSTSLVFFLEKPILFQNILAGL